MRKVELLAPAGTMEALKAAVQNGCDAVYVGGVMFGARAFAGNFHNEEMKEAIAYTHLYGVKLYVTMNTIIYEDEMEEAFCYAKFLYEAGVDALIIQDLGLFDRLRIQIPTLELHASTQMHVHNMEGIRFLKERGASRVVLPRETSIEEISKFTKEPLEFEVFVHGALCISYSGQCYMSEALFQRSGNRGQCAQACRMKYQLIKQYQGKEELVSTDGEYLLSPRDMNTLDRIPELIEAGITSFKIEGRMKRPEYVAQVVLLYRKAIDAYTQGKTFVVSEEMKHNMELIFNRKFTQGHLFHQAGNALMNTFRPNHMGVVIGKVIKATNKKITLRLQGDVTQGDGIRILQSKEDYGFLLNKIYKNDLLVKEAYANDIIELDCSDFIEKDAIALKTSDTKQLQSLQQPVARKVAIHMYATFHIGSPMWIQVSDGVHHVEATSLLPIEMAKTSAMDMQRLKQQLVKSKDTPFEVIEMKVDLDEQCFLSIKEINQVRRIAFDKLLKKRVEVATVKPVLDYQKHITRVNAERSNNIIIIVDTKEQYDACCKEQMTPRYTTNSTLAKQYALEFMEGSVHKTLHNSSLVCEVGGLNKPKATIVQPSLYVTNSYTAMFFEEQGIQQIILPYEISFERIHLLLQKYHQTAQGNVQFGIEIYGYRDLMISEHCPIQTQEHQQRHCGKCKQAQYYLEDVKHQKYPLVGDDHCRMHILSKSAYDEIDQIPMYRKHQIEVFQVRFRLENENQVTKVLHKIKRHFTDEKENAILQVR